jgi:hypothetical protein
VAALARSLGFSPPLLPVSSGGTAWYAWEPAVDLRQWLYSTLCAQLVESTSSSQLAALEAARKWMTGKRVAAPARFLTTAEALKMAASPRIEIGAHSVTHPSLASLPRAQQYFEMDESRRVLERLIGKEVRSFAFPYGKKWHIKSASIRALRDSGYRCGCVNYGRPVNSATSRWALPRYQILNWEAQRLAWEMKQWSQEY